jgi:hypothetical protein
MLNDPNDNINNINSSNDINDSNNINVNRNLKFKIKEDINNLFLFLTNNKNMRTGVIGITTILTLGSFYVIIRQSLGLSIVHTNDNSKPIKNDIVTRSTYESKNQLPFKEMLGKVIKQNYLKEKIINEFNNIEENKEIQNNKEIEITREEIKKIKEL